MRRESLWSDWCWCARCQFLRSWCIWLAGLVPELHGVTLVSSLPWPEKADRVLRVAMPQLVGCLFKLVNGWSLLVLRPANKHCLFLLAVSPMCTASGMSDEWNLWFSVFLYTGPPLLHHICHWLISRVVRRGLLKVVWDARAVSVAECTEGDRRLRERELPQGEMSEGCEVTGSRYVGVPHTHI
jgi:hypothetical protein